MNITDTPIVSCEAVINEVRPSLSIQELTSRLRLIQSDAAAIEFPDKYSLIVVTEECEYGESLGLLLGVADSIGELNKIASLYEGVENELLHYVTGIDLL